MATLTSRPLSCAVAGFVVIFAAANVLSWKARSAKQPDDGYGWTLTFWTLLATAAVAVVPAVPSAAVCGVLALNAVVAALYYSVVNRGPVTGESFLLHGGCALGLMLLIATGAVESTASPLAAAGLTALFVGANAVLQRHYEVRTGRGLYPGATLQHPAWRLAALPLATAGLAAAIAWRSQSTWP